MFLGYVFAIVLWLGVLWFATYMTTRKCKQCDTTEKPNPNMVWAQYMDYLSTKSKIMEKEYGKRLSLNQNFSSDDVYNMNRNVHHDLDLITTGKKQLN